MKSLIPFFTIRAADIYSTYLNFDATGLWHEAEAAPMSRYLIQQVGFLGFIPINLVISAVVWFLLVHYKKRAILYSFMVLNLGIVVSNLIIFWKVLQILH